MTGLVRGGFGCNPGWEWSSSRGAIGTSGAWDGAAFQQEHAHHTDAKTHLRKEKTPPNRVFIGRQVAGARSVDKKTTGGGSLCTCMHQVMRIRCDGDGDSLMIH